MDIVTRFNKIALKYPNNLAVYENKKKFTYKYLHDISLNIATNLSKISKSPKVLILLPQGVYAYASIFGSLISGGYYTPCNVDAPQKKIQNIVDLFKPTIIIYNKTTYKKLSKQIKSSRKIININELIKQKKTFNLNLKTNKNAYVCFTSGSTGIPKGVIISRKALSAYIDWAIRSMKLNHKDRWSQHPNISFDLSVLDIYGALCSGGSLFPLNLTVDRMFPAIAIKKYNLTIWNSVPSVINMMIQAKQMTSNNIKSLRLATFCGEPLLRQHIESIFRAKKNIIVHNTYGPTEATVSMTLLKITSKTNFDKICRESVALGKPITNMGLHLIGGKNKNEGEIVITGPQVAEGYWKLPKENRKSFKNLKIKNKFVKSYYTGDWAINHNGNLFFKNRLDNQAKIKGFRIELETIDNFVRQITKYLSKSLVLNNKLYCFIECKRDQINLNLLEKKFRNTFDEYSIPNDYIILKSFPRNQNDKIDLNQLLSKIK